MDELNPAAIHDPWSALAFVALAVVVYLTWRSSHHARRAADEIVHQANPNSGQSLKDYVVRIEARQIEQGERLAALEAVVERRGTLERRDMSV